MSKFLNKKLGDLAAPGRSVISGPFGSNIGKRFFKEDGVPVIRGNNLTTDFNKFIDDGFVFLTEEKANELNSDAKEGDILFTAAGTIGQVGMIPCDAKYPRYVISNKQLRFRVDKEKADPDYVYYWLASPWIFKTIINRNTGSTVPLINLGIIKSLPINIPEELLIQRAISETLSTIDKKIELNNLINSELEAMAKLLYDYWFVQFDFPDANGKPYKASGGKMVYNPVLKREIPQGWCVCELGEHITFERGISYRSKDITETGTPLVNLNSFALTGKFKPNGTKYFSGSYKPEKLCNIGDLVIAITDVTRNADIIGKSFIVPDAFEGKRALISCDVALVKSSYFGNAYLETLFNSNHYHNYIKQFASGTLVLHLDLKGVNWYRTELPPRELLSRFEDFCTPLFQQRDVVLQENKKLEELRDWLLPMLMNGQVTVKPSTESKEAQHG
ncbi:TPA: restriction endonuclease subunit S [Vibrio parahaemolyticus]